jgi:5'-deoxynucleotidase
MALSCKVTLEKDDQRFQEVDDFRISKSHLKNYSEYIKNMKYIRRWNRTETSMETSVMSHTFVVAALTLVTSCIELHNNEHKLPDNFIYRSILRALFHDVSEVFTGDIITPVKDIIKKHIGDDWEAIERKRIRPLVNAMPEKIKDDLEEFDLFAPLPKENGDMVGKLVKECDRLAALLECLFEQSSGHRSLEMDQAFINSSRRLLSSPWRSIRDIALYSLFKNNDHQDKN